MKKAEIKHISSCVDAIESQFYGWTTKKRVGGKVYRQTAEEQRRMFEQLEKASIELSSMDAELHLELVRLMEAKGGLINNNYAEVQEENPELRKLLERIDRLDIDKLVEPINTHLSIRAEIDHLVTELVEEIKNTAIDIAENCGNDDLQEELNDLVLELERWQQDIANDYCGWNRDRGSLLFEKRNGVYIRDVLGTSFNRTLSRLGRHKKDTYYDMVEPLKEKRDAILQYLNRLREKKRPADSTAANEPPKIAGLSERERSIVLTEKQFKILKYLNEIKRAVAQVDVEQGTYLSKNTVSDELKILKGYGFVAPPKGKKRRVVITQKSIDYLQHLKKA